MVPNHMRDSLVNLGPFNSPIHRITGKQFVTTITTKGNGHMFAGESRKKIGRNQRGITERFVHPGPDLAYEICGEVGAQSLLVMIGTKKLCDPARVSRLIKRCFSK